MIRPLLRAVPAALLGALAGPAWLVLLYVAGPAVDTALVSSPPPRLVRGLYPVERDQNSGLTFAWTAGLMSARFPGLDRRGEWHFDLRARAARSDPSTIPDITVFADGIALVTTPATPDFSTLRVTIPARPNRRGLIIEVRCSATVVPGAHDPRQLGVMVDAMSLSPAGIAMPPPAAVSGAAAATAAAAAAAALIGYGIVGIAATAVLAGGATASVLARGFGPFTDYSYTLVTLSLVMWTVVVLCRGALSVTRRDVSGPASLVMILSGFAVVMKLAVLLHPDMPIGDALFHAHRFQAVLAGNLYFTSIAPGNYAFPYAPGLYVFAMPFAEMVQRGAGDMLLLRSIVIAMDAVAAALLYVAVVRAGGTRPAGVLAALFYHCIPLEYRIATVGNLTNAFSQSLAAIAFAIMMAPLARGPRATAILLTLTLCAAFLSHTSTFAIGSVGAVLIAVLLYARGGPELRPAAVAIAVASVAAAGAAVLLYYAHFVEVYRAEWARISVETAAAAPDAGGRGIVERLSAVPRYLYLHLGIPVLALSAWGGARLRPPTGARLTIAVGGWTLTCLGFLVLGVLTPVDMRHYLAVIPALAVLAGVAVAGGYASGGLRRVAALALCAWAVIIFLHTWWNTLP